jgi:ATP-dependent DNA helicase RecQ
MRDSFHTIGEWLRAGADAELDLSGFTRNERRLVRVVQELLSGASTTGAGDLVAATRQVLRVEQERQHRVPQTFVLPQGDPWPGAEDWDAAGCHVEDCGTRFRVEAHPWMPSWLQCGVDLSVDGASYAELQRRLPCEVLGDPLLAQVQCKNYRNAGQREAIRAVLSAPPSSTLVVVLPTGAGKSLCAHLPAVLSAKSLGTAVVIVPTTSLALDQERALQALFPYPTAFVAARSEDEQLRNREIWRRIHDGTQKIVFTSPESAIQALAGPIYSAASKGLIDTVVIDEAHMVDAWGDDFRSAFQELAGFRTDLLRCSAKPFPTLLLTATLTEPSLDSLETLFGEPGPFKLLASVQLRPEPSYWSVYCADFTQKQVRVIEAVRNLPRPLILYATRRVDADHWLLTLRSLGFRRSEIVTGETPNDQRLSVLKKWRDDSIDIVVATSAFGLGVDKDNVRTVVHACVPESVDRFYQEVGRSGRDGNASISLVAYTKADWIQARNLSEKRLISLDRGLERWLSMFQKAEMLPGGRFRVPVDAVPSFSEGDIDMRNSYNVAWNLRTLTLMARAALLRLDGEPPPTYKTVSDGADKGFDVVKRISEQSPDIEQYRNRRIVKILDQYHLSEDAWSDKVAPLRVSARHFSQRNLELMRQVLSGQECISRALSETYSIAAKPGRGGVAVEASCGGCAGCRNAGTGPFCGSVHAPWPVWRKESLIGDVLRSMLSRNSMLAIFYEDGRGREWKRHRSEVVLWLAGQGVRNIVAPRELLEEWQTLDWKSNLVFFTALDELVVPRLPWLPTMIYHPTNLPAPPDFYRRSSRGMRQTESPPVTVVLFPRTAVDPRATHRVLMDVWPERSVTLQELRSKEAI